MAPVTDFAVILLTQGLRPDDLQRAMQSLLAQQDVTTDIVVVGNGWKPSGLPLPGQCRRWKPNSKPVSGGMANKRNG